MRSNEAEIKKRDQIIKEFVLLFIHFDKLRQQEKYRREKQQLDNEERIIKAKLDELTTRENELQKLLKKLEEEQKGKLTKFFLENIKKGLEAKEKNLRKQEETLKQER